MIYLWLVRQFMHSIYVTSTCFGVERKTMHAHGHRQFSDELRTRIMPKPTYDSGKKLDAERMVDKPPRERRVTLFGYGII